MKIRFLTLFMLVLFVTSYAQMPHIVQGYFLNPDLSKPALYEIKFQGYLSRSPLDTTISTLCGADGAWGLELVFSEKINNANWVPGDTLVVVYENVGEGPFQGARSIFRYVTTSDSPEDVGSIALPVEMTTFTARVRSTALAEEVVLEWHTASESDNLGFEVQRCQDNRSFEKIGFVDGSGFSTEEQGYSFLDKEVAVAKYYYRLKQIDRDGSFSYSDVQEITVAAPDRYELSQNFPNPFNPKTDIIFRVRQDGLVALKVYDILGREVKTLVNKKMNAGTHRISFDGRDLPSGMYLYAITAGGFHDVKKMVLIK
ncbi:T9SS type A sorting domain-containing protein [candidate division KSB1 bacterium]|nr:T9SS type A sorting domain-containing protein [candidate division KSB1 bacterium]